MTNQHTRPTLSAIVAMSENRVIGIDNQLPWRIPADLKHFKTITTGHPILMGRKTFESIGRPLPNRTNIILTRNANYDAPGCVVVTSIDDAIAKADPATEIFIIGGAEIYQQCLARVDQLYLTIVHEQFEGDAFFPELNSMEWREEDRVDHVADNENPYAYSFIKLRRI